MSSKEYFTSSKKNLKSREYSPTEKDSLHFKKEKEKDSMPYTCKEKKRINNCLNCEFC